MENAVTNTREKAGWILLGRLSLIRVTGPQRVKFLHNLLSNDINGLAVGQSRLAALMNLKGQQVAWMRVLAEKDALICELPTAVRDAVVDTFIHYKVGAPVRFEKPDTAVFGLFGKGSPEILTALGVKTVPSLIETFENQDLPDALVRISRGSELPAGGFTLHTPADSAVAFQARLRSVIGEPLQDVTLDTLRVEEGLPWHGIDVVEENLLHETGQFGVYHSSSKGCYLGQEVVARLEGRGGNVNKRLVGLRCGSAVSGGTDIVFEGKVIGRVTTAGNSPEFGPIAMGYVHRTHAEPGSRVRVGKVECQVVPLPFRN